MRPEVAGGSESVSVPEAAATYGKKVMVTLGDVVKKTYKRFQSNEDDQALVGLALRFVVADLMPIFPRRGTTVPLALQALKIQRRLATYCIR